MDEPNKIGIFLRVILALPILLCATISLYTVYEYECCLLNLDSCDSIVISQEPSGENGEENTIDEQLSQETLRGKEILEDQRREAGASQE